jgi:hypothetical protein
MPYKSEAQRKYFNVNRKKLEAQGVDVDEWNQASKGKKMPERVKESSIRTRALKALIKKAMSECGYKVCPKCEKEKCNCKSARQIIALKKLASLAKQAAIQEQLDKRAFASSPAGLAALGGLVGGARGYFQEPEEDEDGKPRSRFSNALLQGGLGAGLGYGTGSLINYLGNQAAQTSAGPSVLDPGQAADQPGLPTASGAAGAMAGGPGQLGQHLLEEPQRQYMNQLMQRAKMNPTTLMSTPGDYNPGTFGNLS